MCLKTTDKRRFKSQLSSEEFFRNNERFHDTNEFNENNVAERKEVAAYLATLVCTYVCIRLGCFNFFAQKLGCRWFSKLGGDKHKHKDSIFHR